MDGGRRFEKFANFSLFWQFSWRRDGGSLDLGMLWKVPCTNSLFYVEKMSGNWLSEENLSAVWVKWARRKKWVFFRQPPPPPPMWPTPVSSTVPLQTTVLACEPLERASNETAAVLVSCSRNYGPPCMFTWLVLNSKDIWNYSKCIRHFLKI